MTRMQTSPRNAAARRPSSGCAPIIRAELAEDYVELIADLIDERGEARGTDIAQRLGVSNATVVKTLKRLQDEELITQEPYRAMFLTDAGRKMAEDGRRNAMPSWKNFCSPSASAPETARIDAEGIEHHVSTETLDAMEAFLTSPRRITAMKKPSVPCRAGVSSRRIGRDHRPTEAAGVRSPPPLLAHRE